MARTIKNYPDANQRTAFLMQFADDNHAYESARKGLYWCLEKLDACLHELQSSPTTPSNSPIEFMGVTIGIGNGCSFGITENSELVLNHTTKVNHLVERQILTGVKTKKQLDDMVTYINRMRIHLPDE